MLQSSSLESILTSELESKPVNTLIACYLNVRQLYSYPIGDGTHASERNFFNMYELKNYWKESLSTHYSAVNVDDIELRKFTCESPLRQYRIVQAVIQSCSSMDFDDISETILDSKGIIRITKNIVSVVLFSAPTTQLPYLLKAVVACRNSATILRYLASICIGYVPLLCAALYDCLIATRIQTSHLNAGSTQTSTLKPHILYRFRRIFSSITQLGCSEAYAVRAVLTKQNDLFAELILETSCQILDDVIEYLHDEMAAVFWSRETRDPGYEEDCPLIKLPDQFWLLQSLGRSQNLLDRVLERVQFSLSRSSEHFNCSDKQLPSAPIGIPSTKSYPLLMVTRLLVTFCIMKDTAVSQKCVEYLPRFLTAMYERFDTCEDDTRLLLVIVFALTHVLLEHRDRMKPDASMAGEWVSQLERVRLFTRQCVLRLQGSLSPSAQHSALFLTLVLRLDAPNQLREFLVDQLGFSLGLGSALSRLCGHVQSDREYWERQFGGTAESISEFISCGIPPEIHGGCSAPGDWLDIVGLLLSTDLLRAPLVDTHALMLEIITRCTAPLHRHVQGTLDIWIDRCTRRLNRSILSADYTVASDGFGYPLLPMEVKRFCLDYATGFPAVLAIYSAMKYTLKSKECLRSQASWSPCARMPLEADVRELPVRKITNHLQLMMNGSPVHSDEYRAVRSLFVSITDMTRALCPENLCRWERALLPLQRPNNGGTDRHLPNDASLMGQYSLISSLMPRLRLRATSNARGLWSETAIILRQLQFADLDSHGVDATVDLIASYLPSVFSAHTAGRSLVSSTVQELCAWRLWSEVYSLVASPQAFVLTTYNRLVEAHSRSVPGLVLGSYSTLLREPLLLLRLPLQLLAEPFVSRFVCAVIGPLLEGFAAAITLVQPTDPPDNDRTCSDTCREATTSPVIHLQRQLVRDAIFELWRALQALPWVHEDVLDLYGGLLVAGLGSAEVGAAELVSEESLGLRRVLACPRPDRVEASAHDSRETLVASYVTLLQRYDTVRVSKLGISSITLLRTSIDAGSRRELLRLLSRHSSVDSALFQRAARRLLRDWKHGGKGGEGDDGRDGTRQSDSRLCWCCSLGRFQRPQLSDTQIMNSLIRFIRSCRNDRLLIASQASHRCAHIVLNSTVARKKRKRDKLLNPSEYDEKL